MKVDQPQLVEIVAKSTSLFNRLKSRTSSNSQFSNIPEVESQIQRWHETISSKNLDLFNQRLTWDELDLDTVRQVLSTSHFVDSLPTWVDTFQVALEACDSVFERGIETDLSKEFCFLKEENPLPFEELLLPFVLAAQQKVITRAGKLTLLISEAAQALLERSLLQTLAHLCAPTFGERFLIFRSYQQPSLIHRIGQLQNSQSRSQYTQFVCNLLQGGLIEFFQEYSVLARLISSVTDCWINNTIEFLERLAADSSAIQATFQPTVELQQVVDIHPRLSDRHENGHAVMALTFASGLKLIYKPKDLGMEVAYSQLLGWFNAQSIFLPFKVLQVLDCTTHGWVEFIEPSPCLDSESAKRYYKRAGILLCLMYGLRGTDCHAENIIACNEHPLLIDMETLMAPQVEFTSDPTSHALSLANQQFNDSVLGTHFLPRWEIGLDNTVYDMSGLGGVGGQATHYCLQKWQNINMDTMYLQYKTVKTRSQANLPTLNGSVLSPSGYTNELIDGFTQMYRFLIGHRSKLLSSESPLSNFHKQRVRFIFRPTKVYSSILNETLQPQFLRNGIDRSIAIDVISKSLLKSETKPQAWSIIAAEHQALEQLDIPLFVTSTDQIDLMPASEQTISNYFTKPSYDLAIFRLQNLSEADLEQQIAFIRGSLYTGTTSKLQLSSRTQNMSSERFELPSRDLLIDQADKIAQELQKRAIRAEDGSVTWMGLNYMRDVQRFQYQPISYDLYDGTSGVGLFLAALSSITGDCKFHDLTLSTLRSFRQTLQSLGQENVPRFIQQIGIGGGKGFASIIYALVRSSQFLKDAHLLAEAHSIASMITPDLIHADRQFDLISGTAGAILGLLTLYEATADRAVLMQAIACGAHLLKHRVCSDHGLYTWATLNGKLLTGYSHGAAGIAYALLRLYRVTQEPAFKVAAIDAISYERSVFSSGAQNYPDFRGEQINYLSSWCHGAPGIALGRLGTLSVLDDELMRSEINIALKTTQNVGIQDIDHLCCGNFGRIEILLVAAHRLQQAHFLDMVQQQAASIINRARTAGTFQISPGAFGGTYNPGFFQGMAGIGYELLRLASRQIPSVLMWE